MPRKSPTTDYKPFDILRQGPPILKRLPRRKIEMQLAASLPNWEALDVGERKAARIVVHDAFLFLIVHRVESRGFPRVAAVKGNLGRIGAALTELYAAMDEMNPRTATFLEKAAGKKCLTAAEYNNSPLNRVSLGECQ